MPSTALILPRTSKGYSLMHPATNITIERARIAEGRGPVDCSTGHHWLRLLVVQFRRLRCAGVS